MLSAEAGEDLNPTDLLKTEQNAPQDCSAFEPRPKVESWITGLSARTGGLHPKTLLLLLC